MVLKGLILGSFYFLRICLSRWIDLGTFVIVNLRGCDGHGRTDFRKPLLWEGMVDLMSLILGIVLYRHSVIKYLNHKQLWLRFT